MDDGGVFRTTIEVQNWELRGLRCALPETLVDTGSEFTWISRRVLEELGIRAQRKQAFEVADGRRIERDIGYALVRAAGTEAPDLVECAHPAARGRTAPRDPSRYLGIPPPHAPPSPNTPAGDPATTSQVGSPPRP